MKRNEAVTQYIESFPEPIQKRLEVLRTTINAIASEATETIAYKMPTYVLNGNLVHFAGYEHHIGFYPTPSAIQHFSNALATYKTSKGAVQFPHDAPLPVDLIERMVRYRLQENYALDPLLKKLGFVKGMTVYAINMPECLEDLLHPLKQAAADFRTDFQAINLPDHAFVLVYVTDFNQTLQTLQPLFTAYNRPSNVWVIFPKKAFSAQEWSSQGYEIIQKIAILKNWTAISLAK